MPKRTRTRQPTPPTEVTPQASTSPKVRNRLDRFIAQPGDIEFIPLPKVTIINHAPSEGACSEPTQQPAASRTDKQKTDGVVSWDHEQLLELAYEALEKHCSRPGPDEQLLPTKHKTLSARGNNDRGNR